MTRETPVNCIRRQHTSQFLCLLPHCIFQSITSRSIRTLSIGHAAFIATWSNVELLTACCDVVQRVTQWASVQVVNGRHWRPLSARLSDKYLELFSKVGRMWNSAWRSCRCHAQTVGNAAAYTKHDKLQPLDQHAGLAPDDSKLIGERSISLFEGNTGFAGQTGNWEQLHENDKVRSTDEYNGRMQNEGLKRAVWIRQSCANSK